MVIGLVKKSDKSPANGRQPQATPAQLESHVSCSTRLPEASSPADAHRARLAGRSKELLCPADSGPVNTDTAGTTSRASPIRKSSRNLLAALQRRQPQRDISSEATPGAAADTETESSAVSVPSRPVTKKELSVKSLQKLLVSPIEPNTVVHSSNSAAVAKSSWAMMSGKSSRRLLPAVLESDSAPTSPATSAVTDSSSITEAACSAGPEPRTTGTARGIWTKMGRSARQLLSGTAGEDAKAASHTKSQTSNVTTSSEAPGRGISVKHMIKALAGRSVQAGTAKPHPSQQYKLSNLTNSSAAKLANKSLAGQSSRKLLSVAATESACNKNKAAARIDDMLKGRSSRRLLRMSIDNREDAAAPTPSTAVSRQNSSAGRSSISASSSTRRLLVAGRQSQSGSASACGTVSASEAWHEPVRQVTTTRNNKAMLASTSTRKLLGVQQVALIQPDVPSVSADKASLQGDAVVHIQSTDISSKTDKAASTPAVADASEEYAEPPARASKPSSADVSSLAILLQHAADKEVLVEAVSQLHYLADSSYSCKLMIGQCCDIIQGLADLLLDSDEDLQEAATTLINNLSSGAPNNQAKMASNNALVDGLIKMLGSSVTALKMLGGPNKGAAIQATRAAVALWTLAADNSVIQGRICARHPGGGRTVARHLYDMMLYPATGAYAAGLTWILVASNSDNQAMFADVESVRRLLMLMVEGSEMEGEYAAGALTCLLGGHAEAVRSASTIALGHRVQMLLLEGAGSTAARASMHEIVEMMRL